MRLPGGPLVDSGVPLEESMEYLAKLQADGVIKHIGLRSASAEQIERAKAIIPVDAAQNACFVGGGQTMDVIHLCTAEKIPFFAYFPLGMGTLIQKKLIWNHWLPLIEHRRLKLRSLGCLHCLL